MPSASARVVVVEDDDSGREATARLLDAAGFSVVAFESAETLLADTSWLESGCIVSDWKLPALSGLDLLSSLRERGVTMPLILVTAHDSPRVRDEAMRCGAAAYLAKPFHAVELLDAVRTAIASYRA